MKKQLIAATIVASISTISTADISISGSSKVNAKGGVYTHEADVTMVGKSGATSVVAQIGADMGAFTTEQLFTKTSVAGVNVKAGTWKSGKGELGQNVAGAARVNLSTSMNGIGFAYEDRSNNGGASTTVSGKFQGIKLSHKFKEDKKSETSASAKMGSISASLLYKNQSNDKSDSALTLKGSVQGMDLTFVKTSSDNGTSMDGFIGKASNVTAGTAIGISTSIGGNKVTFKNIDMDIGGVASDTNQKLILTRQLTSGSTFEAIYDKNADSLDLEFGVKF